MKTGHRIAGLDGLRAVAILGIIAFHLFPGVLPGGFLGVNLFFVLSGYLIAISAKRSARNDSFRTTEFYRKRIRRIYPNLLIFVTAAAIAEALWVPDARAGLRSEGLSILLGYNNIWQILQDSSYFTKITGTSPLTHMWSMAVELQFYLIWPLLFFLIREVRKRGFDGKLLLIPLILLSLLALLLFYRPDSDPTRVYYGTDTRIFALLLGSFLGLSHRRKMSPLWEDAAAAGALVLLLFFFVVSDGHSALTYRLYLPLSAFLAGILTKSCADHGRIRILLEAGPLREVGKFSYELYLVMYPVIYFLNSRPLFHIPILDTLIAIALIPALAVLLRKLSESLAEGFGRNRAAFGADILLILTGGAIILASPGSRVTAEDRELAERLEKNSELLESLASERAAESGTESESAIESPPAVGSAPATPADAAAAALPSLPGSVRLGDYSDYTFIGDSVMLDAADAILNYFPGAIIDAKISRQVSQAVKVVSDLAAKNELRHYVVIALGGNGAFTAEQGEALIRSIGSDHEIYWVLPYGKYFPEAQQSDAMIRQMKEEFPEITLIDWVSESEAHGEWFYKDGMHLKPSGYEGYAKFLADSLPAK